MANAKRDGAAPEEVKDLRGAIEWMKKEGDIVITDKECQSLHSQKCTGWRGRNNSSKAATNALTLHGSTEYSGTG